MQHNLLSWELDGPHFKEVEQVADSSIIIDRSVKSWLQQHSSAEREQFVEAIYEMLTSSHATTLSELAEQWKSNPAKALSALLVVEPQTRKTVIQALHQLFHTTRLELQLDVKTWFQEKLQEVMPIH